MTNWSTIDSFDGLLLEANRYGEFWSAMFFMLWAVLTITFLPFGISVALLASSFSVLLIGIFLVYMQLIGWASVMMPVGVIIGIAIWEALFSKKE
jgi:hypothetical protein